MLERTLEPEVMESNEEAVAYDEMDHQDVNECFVRDLIHAGGTSGEVLDLGTGTARIPIMLCDHIEDVRVVGADLSVEMLDVARINIELSPHLERVMLTRCDAKGLDFEDDRFDVAMSNSIVHHIADPTTTFAEAVRVCKPGGLLFFRDLIRPESDEQVRQFVETYAGSEPEFSRKMFDDSLRAAFTVQEIQEFVAELGFAEDSVSATSDRHWTWSARK